MLVRAKADQATAQFRSHPSSRPGGATGSFIFSFGGSALSDIDDYVGFIPAMRAGGLPLSLFLGRFFYIGLGGTHGGRTFIGFKRTSDDHFSFIAAILASADLFKRFLGSCFGHFCLPPV
jgi:hypothetical protein